MKKENIDKTVQAIKDGKVVYEGIQKAREDDDKISFAEGGVLFVRHAGKALRFIKSIEEIGAELADLDTIEAEELITELIKLYDPTNPLVKSGIKKIIVGSVSIKEGIVDLIEAKK